MGSLHGLDKLTTTVMRWSRPFFIGIREGWSWT